MAHSCSAYIFHHSGRTLFKTILACSIALMLAISAVPSRASVIYSYIGKDFGTAFGTIDTNDFVTATFSLDEALTANTSVDLTTLSGFELYMSAGPLSLDYADFNFTVLETDVTTDSLGNIVEWGLLLDEIVAGGTQRNSILTRHRPGYNLDSATDRFTIGLPRGNWLGRGSIGPAGTWTMSVPAPTTIWLFGSALIWLRLPGTRRKKYSQ